MQMIKTPVNGMKDIEPKEMELRQFLLNKIREVYGRFGFLEIGTPAMEHIENLLSDLGWDNEKLIFKVLKRGEKLEKAKESNNVNDLIDAGLRYDLTVPLTRFYTNNKDKLVSPFKAMQIGNVYRADRPQKGRFREFMQCDIDIFGEATNLGEIEVLLATCTFLNKIGFSKYNFSIDINDRRILREIHKSFGFNDDTFETFCISFDKLDKIGVDEVNKELAEKGLVCDISKVIEFKNIPDDLKYIIDTVEKLTKIKVNFNPTLVRGMGYYTGTIFEVKCEKFAGSVGGGGRYDKMVAKFGGPDTPALGISIGFERIIGIMMEDNFTIPKDIKKIAYLIDKDTDNDKKRMIIEKALSERKSGNIVYIAEAMKNKKFQIENLEKLGYTEFPKLL